MLREVFPLVCHVCGTPWSITLRHRGTWADAKCEKCEHSFSVVAADSDGCMAIVQASQPLVADDELPIRETV